MILGEIRNSNLLLSLTFQSVKKFYPTPEIVAGLNFNDLSLNPDLRSENGRHWPIKKLVHRCEPSSLDKLVFLKITMAGGKPGIFWVFFALLNSAT